MKPKKTLCSIVAGLLIGLSGCATVKDLGNSVYKLIQKEDADDERTEFRIDRTYSSRDEGTYSGWNLSLLLDKEKKHKLNFGILFNNENNSRYDIRDVSESTNPLIDILLGESPSTEITTYKKRTEMYLDINGQYRWFHTEPFNLRWELNPSIDISSVIGILGRIRNTSSTQSISIDGENALTIANPFDKSSSHLFGYFGTQIDLNLGIFNLYTKPTTNFDFRHYGIDVGLGLRW